MVFIHGQRRGHVSLRLPGAGLPGVAVDGTVASSGLLAVQFIAKATLPSGLVRKFAGIPTFDSYVKYWREAGYVLTWHDPRTVTISKGVDQ